MNADLFLGHDKADARIDVTLPLDALTTMIAIIGRRGSGKTTTALVLAEEFIKAEMPVVLLDPLGVHYGLRSSRDGQRAGLPVTILGGAHADLPIEATAGALIADLVVDQPGAYIIDFSSFESRSAERRFATDFAERLYRAKAGESSALGLIVDEADTFAPQQARGEERMLGAFEAIARRGRVRGLGMVAITQRPAVLNKNVLSQCEVMIAHQLTAPQDRDAVQAWAEGNASREQTLEFLNSLASLQVGEAWLWSPAWLDKFQRIQVRLRETFDSSATPKAGEVRIEPRVLAPVDLEALRARMAESLERVIADDPKALKIQVERLTTQLAAKAPAVTCDHEPIIAELNSRIVSLQGQVQEARSSAEKIAAALGRDRARIDQAVADREDLIKIVTQPIPEVWSTPPAKPAKRQAPAREPSKGRDTNEMTDDEVEQLVNRILERKGMIARVEVPPAEMIRHEYQQRTVERLLDKVGQMGPDAREVMRFVLAHEDSAPLAPARIMAGISDYRQGRPADKWTNAIRALSAAGFLAMNGRGGSTGYTPHLREWVATEMAAHNPSIEDVEATYQAALGRIAIS